MWCIARFGTTCTISKMCRLKPATLLKLTLLHGCFSRFLNCTNGTKSRNAPHMLYYKLEKFFGSVVEGISLALSKLAGFEVTERQGRIWNPIKHLR